MSEQEVKSETCDHRPFSACNKYSKNTVSSTQLVTPLLTFSRLSGFSGIFLPFGQSDQREHHVRRVVNGAPMHAATMTKGILKENSSGCFPGSTVIQLFEQKSLYPRRRDSMPYPARPLDITETTLAANLFSSPVLSAESPGGCGNGPTGCTSSGKLS